MKKALFLTKTLSLILCISICFSLTGCIKQSFNFKFSQEPENVVSMKIYNITDSVAEHEVDEKELIEFEPIKEIDQTRYAEVMEKIESFTFNFAMLVIAPAPSPSFGFYGLVLYIEYEDGGYSIMDKSTRLNFDKDGNFVDSGVYFYYGYSEEFDRLLEELAGENLE